MVVWMLGVAAAMCREGLWWGMHVCTRESAAARAATLAPKVSDHLGLVDVTQSCRNCADPSICHSLQQLGVRPYIQLCPSPPFCV